MGNDAGYSGNDLRSLAGVKAQPGLGIKTATSTFTIGTGTSAQVCYVNSLRYWLVVSADVAVSVFLGEESVGSNTYLQLNPGGNVLINTEFPWTGAIQVLNNSGSTGHVNVTEASVSQ